MIFSESSPEYGLHILIRLNASTIFSVHCRAGHCELIVSVRGMTLECPQAHILATIDKAPTLVLVEVRPIVAGLEAQ